MRIVAETHRSVVEVSNYGACMHAAPLDGRDDTGDDGGDGPDGHGDGGTSEHSRRLPAAAGLIGVLVAIVALLWLLSLTGRGGGDTEGQGSEVLDEGPFEVPTTSSPLREPESMVDVGPAAEEPASTPPAEPFSDLQGWLVYLSGSHVVRLDLATGAVERVPIEAFGSILALADMTLLTDGKRTVGLSLTADDPLTSVLVASDALVVPSTEPLADFWVISRPHGPAGAIRLNAWQDYGVLTGELRAPPGSELLVIGDAGPLVNPPVGGTFRPTFAGFQAVSEHRLLAGNSGLRVEQRCDERLACAIVAVDATTEQATELPQELVAEVAGMSVSPNGRWLLNDTSPAWLFDLGTQELRLLDVGGYGRPQWSDDSASVAWLTTDRTPTLVVALTEPPEREKGWLVVELAGLGADPSPGTSFLLDSTLSPR